MVGSRSRSSFMFALLTATGFLTLSGCAVRKSYVNQQVAALKPAIDEATNQSKETATRIDAVDRRAQQATAAAASADQKATQATTLAQAAQQVAQTADGKSDTASRDVGSLNTRIDTVDTRVANAAAPADYRVDSTRTITFAFNSSTLSSNAQETLDSIAERVLSLRTGYLVELQGFTDAVGPDNYNIALSSQRAESVKRYLLKQRVPLFRISILGLGKEKAVADNKTKAGRDHNRRVEIAILTASTTARSND